MRSPKIMKNKVSFHVNEFYSLFAIFFVMVLASTNGNAQDRNSQQNLHPGIPYSISDIESINLTNGNLLFNFGFGAASGRGTASTGISLKYNSRRYESHVMTTLDTQGDPFPQQFLREDVEGGWKYDGDFELRVINRNSFVDNPAQPGGQCEVPSQDAVYVWKLIMHFPDGSQHEFRPTGYSDNAYNSSGISIYDGNGYFNVDTRAVRSELSWTSAPSDDCPGGTVYSVAVGIFQDPQPKMVYYSSDGTFMRLEIPAGQSVNPSQWTLYLPDGSKVTKGELDAQNNPLPQRIYDKNGNFVTKATITLPDGSAAEGYIDQLGRYIARKAVSSLEDHIIKLGVNGEQIVWKVRWKYITVIKKYTTSSAGGGIGRCCFSDQILTAQPRVIDEIEMPSQLGLLKYTFEYDGHEGQVAWNQSVESPNSSPGWGDLVGVILPSGAKAEYDYATDAAPWIFADQWLPQLGKVKTKRLIYETSYDGSIQLNTDVWTYSVNESGTSTVTNPDGGVATQYFYATDVDSELSGRVYKEISPNGTITERIWINNEVGGCPQYGCGSMRRLNTYVKAEFTTIADSFGNPSLTAIKDFEYDKNGNVIRVVEYDWVSYGSIPHDSLGQPSLPGSVVPVRITENVFYNQTETASNSTANNLASYWNSSAPNVRNAIRSTEVKNSSGGIKARSEFYYDDPTNKGNLIEARVWDSTRGAVSDPLTVGNSVSTFSQYDQYGNVTLATDARGVQTAITYGTVAGPAGSVTGLYPTQTVAAVNYPTLKRTSTAVYDFYTGAVTLATDADNNVSVATEYDAVGRPVKVRSVAGTALESWVRTEYDDVARRVVVRSDLEAIGDGKRVAVQHFDQLGRVRLARTLENAATEDAYNETHGIKVQTRYGFNDPTPLDPFDPQNTLGSYVVTSNPYRAATAGAASGEATMGWTRQYGANTGRHSEVETFSGASMPAPWGGNTATTGVVLTDSDADAATATDQAGKKRRSITNALGQLIRVDEPDGAGNLGTVTSPVQPTYYAYDTLGKMVHVQQGVQNRYFLYDSLGRLLRVRQPEQEVNTALNTTQSVNGNTQWTAGFTYDGGGNALTSTDARNVTTTNTYDALNRVLTRSYSDLTPAVTNYYDGNGLPSVPAFSKGKLTRVSSGISESRYTQFDISGRLLQFQQITDGETYTSSYEYNLSGALIKETYPSGRVVNNDLDQNGDIARIYGRANGAANEMTYADTFTYTPDGRIEQLRLGNGLWEAAKLNSRLQVTEFSLGHTVGSGDLWKLVNEYGELNPDGTTVNALQNTGNVAKQTLTFNGLSQPVVQTYKYDSLYRITEARETAGTAQTWIQNWSYDRYGNRTGFSQNIAGNTSAPNPATDPGTNRFSAGQGFAYDKNGNIINDVDSASSLTRQFIFNADNKQTEVKRDGVTVGQYFYDGEGRRVKKITDTETTVFVYSAGKLIAEYSTQFSQNPGVSYTITDQLGSPRIIVNALGEVVSRRDFLPFGEEIFPDGTYRTAAQKYGQADSVRQRFTGYQRDDETGLDFAEARYYNNRHGRFTAVDPLLASGKSANPQSFNRYVYVLNNPLILTDPNGLQAGTFAEFNFSVYVRAFAPFEWFGPGNVARGDNRGFSTDVGASYRIQASSEVTAANDGRYFPMSITRPSPPTISETNLGFYSWTAYSEGYVNDPNGSYYGDGLPGGNDSLGYHLYGNDDAIPIVSSDIDLRPEFRFNYADQGNGVVNMTVTGQVTGDQFPAAEAFIRDTNGNAVVLGVFAPAASSGPVTSLPGNNTRPMIDVNVTVQVNNGVFQGVVENGNIISLEEYNRRFTDQSPVRPNQ